MIRTFFGNTELITYNFVYAIMAWALTFSCLDWSGTIILPELIISMLLRDIGTGSYMEPVLLVITLNPMEKVGPNIRLASEINTTYEAFTTTCGSNPTCARRVIVSLTLNPMGTAYQTSGGVGSVGNDCRRMRWRAGFTLHRVSTRCNTESNGNLNSP